MRHEVYRTVPLELLETELFAIGKISFYFEKLTFSYRLDVNDFCVCSLINVDQLLHSYEICAPR